MTVYRKSPWYLRIRARILFPSISLFVLFAAMAIYGATSQLTELLERDARKEMQQAGAVLDELVRETEQRVSLHARFVSDMMRLTEAVPETGIGRAILIYILEYSRQEQFRTRIFHQAEADREPFRRLVQRGLLGIRAAELAGSSGAEPPAARIAAVSPILRGEGIRDAVVSWLDLDDRTLQAFSRKAGTDLSIAFRGVLVATSHGKKQCADKIQEMLTPEFRDAVLAGPEPRVRELNCDGQQWKMLFQPVEVGFTKSAIAVVSYSMEPLVIAKARVVRNTLLAAVGLLLAAIWSYTVIVRKITRPIRILSRATRNVDEDGIGRRVAVNARNEIGELARGYNAMIRRLLDNKTELEEYHRKEMERADRLATLGELAGGIAHEIRNPLAGISGAMECFDPYIPKDGTKREMYVEVQNQIDRMENLTRDLLDYSRPRPPQLRESDLHDLLDRACLLLAIGAKDGRIRIEKSFQPDLPPVRVDPEKMQQVFLNILLNCMQAMPEGGRIGVETCVRTDEGVRSVQVRIRDSGPGMSAEVLKNAMRPFFTTKHKGTGLGLAIARQIAESHGGELTIESAPGEGSSFTIRIPQQEP